MTVEKTKLSPKAQTKRRTFRLFTKDRSGAAAVEFGIVALPFFLLLFAIMEVGLVFFGSLQLEHAAEESARLIRTGQAHDNGFNQADFRDEVCGRIIGLVDCQTRLQVEVKTFADFSAVEYDDDPLDSEGELRNDFGYNMGGAESIVLVRVFYEWPLMAAIPGIGLHNMANGNRLLSAATTFRNEPF